MVRVLQLTIFDEMTCKQCEARGQKSKARCNVCDLARTIINERKTSATPPKTSTKSLELRAAEKGLILHKSLTDLIKVRLASKIIFAGSYDEVENFIDNFTR